MLEAGLGGYYGQRWVNMSGPWVDWLGFWPVSFRYNALHWTEYLESSFCSLMERNTYLQGLYSMPNFTHNITTSYHPKLFLSGAIEKELERSVSILRTFKPLATMFQRPWVSPTTSLLLYPCILAWLNVEQSIFYVQLHLTMLYLPTLALI